MGDDMDKKVDDILALLRGEPGPFLDNGKSFFGCKNVDPSMKDAKMQTDCGGMLITRSKMTYGEADALAARVDLVDYPAFVAGLTPCAYWCSPYGEKRYTPEGVYFKGEARWSIYSYMATKGYLDKDPKSYDNSMEYLYEVVLSRLVAAGVWTAADHEVESGWPDGWWFRFWGEPL